MILKDVRKGRALHSQIDLHEFSQLLSTAERRITAQLAGVLAEQHCSVEQWRALMLLSDSKGHAMGELAGFTLLPAPSLTRLVDRMVADNLVYRKADPRDRRSTLVYSTARGRALHRRLLRHIDQQRETVIESADTDDLRTLLNRLIELLH